MPARIDYDALGERTCKDCQQVKPMEQFAKCNRRKDGSWGRTSDCNTCRKRRATARSHGLSVADYDRLLAEQGGVCAICEDPPGEDRLHIDHDHATGEVRGLLCYRCNVGLGYFLDSPDRLKAARQYVLLS